MKKSITSILLALALALTLSACGSNEVEVSDETVNAVDEGETIAETVVEDITDGEEKPVESEEPKEVEVPTYPILNDENCVMVEQGELCEYDLDGDGTAESIQVYAPGSDTYDYSKQMFKINGKDFSEAIKYVTFGTPHYCILDIDRSDGLFEIGVMDCGPSSDYYTTVYRYRDGELYKTGGFPGTFEEERDYRGFSDTVCNGDGTVTSYIRFGILQTWFGKADFKLEGDKIERVEQPLYDSLHGAERPINVISDFPAYTDMDTSSELVTVPAGETVYFLRTDNKEWVEFKVGGEIYYLHVIDYGDIVGGGKELRSWDVFENLCFAD